MHENRHTSGNTSPLRLSIGELLASEIDRQPFDFSFPFADSKLDLPDGPVEAAELLAPDAGLSEAPCRISGELRNAAGYVTADIRIELPYTAQCARCGRTCAFTLDVSQTYMLRPQKQSQADGSDNETDILYFTGSALDLSPAVADMVVLNMPSRHLCREDCKGLCPVCGADLNAGGCGCDTKTRDPRWAALDQLTDNN